MPLSKVAGLFVIITLALLALDAPRTAAAQGLPGWQDTGLRIGTNPNDPTTLCFDALQPNRILIGTTGVTAVYDWSRRQQTNLAMHRFDGSLCNPDGSLFDRTTAPSAVIQYSVADPFGYLLTREPNYFASDGSAQVYSLTAYGDAAGQLWASPDAGKTWQQMSVPSSAGVAADLYVTPQDPKAIYLVTSLAGDPNDGTVDYTVFFSANGGQTWERRSGGQNTGASLIDPGVGFAEIPGQTASANTVVLSLSNGVPGSNHADSWYLSTDGARTFLPLKSNSFTTSQTLVSTSRGMLFLYQGNQGSTATLYAINSGDQTRWSQLALPPMNDSPQTGYHYYWQLSVAANEPDNIFLRRAGGSSDNAALWYSPAGGANWTKLADQLDRYLISPYAPLTVIGVLNGAVYMRDLSAGDATLTGATLDNNLPDNTFFAPTGHNLHGSFATYWRDHGGLAQFGYPRTEPIREVSATNGRVYTVQYFERNRFELHPENQPPNDVLLGLLGSQLSQPLRQAGNGAFNHFDDLHYPGATYFPQTGHNLRNSFLDYWNAHGGLALYGYPISEEFEQVSPTDGKTYVVQYFQRNRFEYHPENKGTANEVLLGLLGTDLLKQKGWLK